MISIIIPAYNEEAVISETLQALIPGVERSEDLKPVISASREGTATFVDARKARDYSESHVMGAVSLPSGELSARLLACLSPSFW